MATVFSLTPVFRPVIWTWQMHQSFHDFANENGIRSLLREDSVKAPG